MATSFVREDDETANIVLRDMHKELLSQINVDEITVYLISAGMITDPQRDALQNDRCYWGLKTLLAALKGNKLYQPHIELASKIEEEYCKRLQRSSSFVQPVSQPGSFVSLQRQQQAPDPRTGESPPSTMSPTGSQYCLQFSQPGSYTVKVNYLSDGSESFQSQSVGRHRNRKDTESHDDEDHYSSCHSSLSSVSSPPIITKSPSTYSSPKRVVTLADSELTAVLKKHKRLQDSQEMKIILVGDSSAINMTYKLYQLGTGYLYQYVHHTEKNTNVKMILWDTMGQERCRSITRNFYLKSDVAIIVFDLVTENTFNQVNWWLKELHDQLSKDRKNIPILLAGNKNDLLPSENASIKVKARQKAFDLGMKDFIVVSAMNGTGMDELFGRAVSLALDNMINEEQDGVIRVAANNTNRNSKFCMC